MMTKSMMTASLIILCFAATTVKAQEKGNFKNNPKIDQRMKNSVQEPERAETLHGKDDVQNGTTNLKSQSQFEPVKQINPSISEEDLKIQEGETNVVEIVDSIFAGDQWVKVAQYYEIWDTRSINPYQRNPLDFNGPVDITLYNPSENRMWSTPMARTPVTSNFRYRWGKWHSGTDLDLETGDTVRSTYDGIIRVVAFQASGYGSYIVIRHYNGLETVYGHLSKQLVQSGQLVKAGEVIGIGGDTGRSTGSHLHYENRYEGNAFDSKNIYDWPVAQIKSDHFILTSEAWNHLSGTQQLKNQPDPSGAPTAYARSILHKVRAGDTLSSIAGKYGISVSSIVKMNNISVRSNLRLGQKIKIK